MAAYIQIVATQIRKVLKAAEVGPGYWPLALRYANAVNRSIRRDETPNWPPFLSDLVVRKTRWNRDDFRPTMEVEKYVATSKQDHGHWIIGKNSQVRLTRCVLRKVEAEAVPTEAQQLAIGRQIEDAQTLRRRLRKKAAVRRLEGEVGESEDKRRNDLEGHRGRIKVHGGRLRRPSWKRGS